MLECIEHFCLELVRLGFHRGTTIPPPGPTPEEELASNRSMMSRTREKLAALVMRSAQCCSKRGANRFSTALGANGPCDGRSGESRKEANAGVTNADETS